MTPDNMSYEQAREYILANYFDGDDNIKAVVGGDEETIAMAKAVEALTECLDKSQREFEANEVKMKKLYAVLISESYVRDAQALVPELFPENFDFDDYDAVWDYACDPMNDCWGDCAGGIFVDVVRANSDEDAIDCVSKSSGYDKRILTSICVNDN